MIETSTPSPVLVTGAGGLIGSAIARRLSDKSTDLRLNLAPRESEENIRGVPNARVLRCDVRDAAALREAAAGCAAVIHCAALNKLWHRPARDFYDINVKGTQNALEAALTSGARRFVYVSSCEVMGPALPGPPADETRPLDAGRIRGHYEMSKFIAERKALSYAHKGLDVIGIRPTGVVGPGDIHGTPPGRLIRAFLRREIKVYYDAGINVVDSRDVADACVAALTRGRGGEAYIAGGHNVTLSELFALLSEASGAPEPGRTVGYRTALAAAYAKELAALFTGRHPGITANGVRTVRHPWHFDCAKARRELGLSPRPLAETVRDAVAWHSMQIATSRTQ